MTNTIHPWTMYEIARSRDEERLLRARAALQALRASGERPAETASERSRESISWFDRIHLSSLFQWAQAHHLRPHHARHV
jgi:hypothetical protein